MDELGQILRQARENKGLSLEEVNEQTRISVRYLEALENGDYSALPTATHTRGFLRNYARFLDLEPQPLVERYVQSQANQSRPAAAQPPAATPSTSFPAPQIDEQPFFDPVNVEVDLGSRRDPESAVRLVIIAALIIALALVGNRFLPLLFNNNDGSEAITDGITNVVQDLMGDEQPEEEGAEESGAMGEASATPGAGEDVINSTGRSNTGPDTEILPTPSPTRPTLPATLDEINLKAEITERTWLESTIDGEVVFSGIARAGDTFEWTAEEEAKLLTGNAIGVFVTINDIPLGRLGDRGQNKEEIWRTTQE
ncbi:MAG: helix-turn-helix domain-containing protein [Candidatus Promineifilaceae bacterium]|jgi:cytoskeleton protein RodZ